MPARLAISRPRPSARLRNCCTGSVGRRGDVDLFEINEAFAVVVLAAMRDLDLPHDKVNVHGGACALGHPIGASGAQDRCHVACRAAEIWLRRGVAALCIGGGEATAIAIEREG